MAGEDQRPLGVGDLPGGDLSCLAVAVDRRAEAGQAGDDLVEGGVLGARLLLERVLGDVDVDGPGRPVRARWNASATTRGMSSAFADQVVVLRHRQRDAGDVDLLERVLADQRAGHVAGDRDHRDRVELRGGDAGHEVRRAGAAGAHAHADPAGRPGVAVGGVAAALLVADEDVAELGVVAQDVVERQDDAARVAEEDVDALADERLAERVGADPRPLARPRVSWSMSLRACSTAAAPAEPSAGTWLRLAGASAGLPVGGSPFVIVIRLVLRPAGPATSRTCKDPRLPARVPSVFGGRRLAALVPPRSSVLPPGAGNEEAKKAIKPGKERAKRVEKGYVGRVCRSRTGHGHAAAIGRDDDGDLLGDPAEEAQATRLPCWPAGGGFAQSRRRDA